MLTVLSFSTTFLQIFVVVYACTNLGKCYQGCCLLNHKPIMDVQYNVMPISSNVHTCSRVGT